VIVKRALLLLALLPAVAQARVVERIAAVVNDEIIMLSEVEDHAAPVLRQVEAIPDPVTREQQRQKQLRRALDDLVSARLISQEATKRKLTITGEEVQAHIDRVKAQQGWDDDQLRMYLSGQGMNLAELRDQVREQLLRTKVIRAALGEKLQISDSDLKEYYRTRKSRARDDVELEGAHILIPLSPEPTAAEVAAAEQQARELIQRARNGEDFAELAKKYSQGPAAESGGYLGSFRRGSLDPALEEAMFGLQAGEIGGPVRSRFGIHVVKVISRKEVAPPDFETIKPQLQQELFEERMESEVGHWVEELKKKAFIEVRL
jgi:peptidyl-prolyl cis-trans isomerase SurA